MSKLLLLLLLSVAFCSVFALTTTEKGFISWLKENRKTYANNEEFKHRFKIYQTNLQFIEEHNSKNLGFTLAMNKFGDLTSEEYAERYLSTPFDATKRPISKNVYSEHLVGDSDVVDWRLKGAVTSVKNQEQCGSCWAFSTAASIEGAWAIAMGDLYSLSPQQIMDCSSEYGNMGCSGGLIDPSFQYVIDNGGIDTEDSYPYEAESSFNCRYKNDSDSLGAAIDAYNDIHSQDEYALTSAVYHLGPVSGAIDASRSTFQFYSSGVYYDDSCSSQNLDHGINVVGYGVTDDETEYYIVKNMWGTDWGTKGYVLMSRNRDNNCGIATMASYAIISQKRKNRL